jgi:hypothetical protein
MSMHPRETGDARAPRGNGRALDAPSEPLARTCRRLEQRVDQLNAQVAALSA